MRRMSTRDGIRGCTSSLFYWRACDLSSSLCSYVPIAAVSVAVLSLGVGAVYVAGTAAATGTISGLLGAVSADMAATLPTVRRLYKYAKQGQRIVQIGQVIGIGGGAALTSRLTGGGGAGGESTPDKEEGKSKWSSWVPGMRGKLNKKKGASKGQPMTEEELKQLSEQQRAKVQAEEAAFAEAETRSTARALRNLLEGSVLSSHGWLMSSDRTLRIVGGPRAIEVEGFLVIETDTYEPFRVVDEKGKTVGEGVEALPAPEEVDQAAAEKAITAAGETAEGGEKEKITGVEVEAEDTTWRGRLTNSLNEATASATVTYAEWKKYVTEQAAAAQEQWAAKRAQAAQAKEEKDKAKVTESTETEVKAVEKKESEDAEMTPAAESEAAPAAETPSLTVTSDVDTPAADDDESEDDKPPSPRSSPIDKLVEMGYSRQESRQALLKHQGSLEEALEWLLNKDKEEVQFRQSQGEMDVDVPGLQKAATAAQEEVSDSSAPADPATVAVVTEPAAESTSETLAVPGAQASTSSSAAASPSLSPLPSPAPGPPSPGRILPVKNAEGLTQQHWLSRAQDKASEWTEVAENTPVVGSAIKFGTGTLWKRGDGWLSKDGKDASTSAKKAGESSKK